jgi:hypothetical protein
MILVNDPDHGSVPANCGGVTVAKVVSNQAHAADLVTLVN